MAKFGNSTGRPQGLSLGQMFAGLGAGGGSPTQRLTASRHDSSGGASVQAGAPGNVGAGQGQGAPMPQQPAPQRTTGPIATSRGNVADLAALMVALRGRPSGAGGGGSRSR